MKLGGRISAAIEVLDEFGSGSRPVSSVLSDWGRSHRFAGSSDRLVISDLVHSVLRRRNSTSYLMNSDSSRHLVLGILLREGRDLESLNAELSSDRFSPSLLTESEHRTFCSRSLTSADDHIRADIPDWLTNFFVSNFGDDWLTEAEALSERAPVDLRVNGLKSDRDKVRSSLKKFAVTDTPISRFGLRVGSGGRGTHIQATPSFRRGLFEVQDEGSQIVSDLVFAQPGEQILDFCAGAGGKTLALSSLMNNRGQIYAYDSDPHRLKKIFDRLTRAGVRNTQVIEEFESLPRNMDRVIVDAPCSGSGAWRRRPETKWKLTRERLEERLNQQDEILSQASLFVRPGGFLVYITCSVLGEENEGRVLAFLEDHNDFELLSAGEVWEDLFGVDAPKPWSSDMKSITLTPASTGTDGFFFAVLGRAD